MIKLIIENCNSCRVEGSKKVLVKLYNEFRIAHPNRWQIMMHQRGRNKWDGYINYISEYGKFKIGLLGKVYDTLISWGEAVEVVDNRPPLGIEPYIPSRLGDSELYPAQRGALKNLLESNIGGVPFLICAGDYAVGFGKSLIFCALFKAFHRQVKTVLLLNDADLFKQFQRELPLLLPEENISFIRGKQVSAWGNFTVAMVQSLASNIKHYQRELSSIGMVLIDEADVIDNKTYKTVINHLWNSSIRIGLSGTLYMSDLKKKQVHNLNIMSFIGAKVDKVSLKDQIDSGRASPVIVKLIKPDFKGVGDDYHVVYTETIVDNEKAYEIILDRVRYNLSYNRIPMLVVTKYIPHCEKVNQYLSRHLGKKYRLAFMHNEVKNRDQIMQEVRDGNVDILISTLVIARGKNIPQLKYILNTSAIDAQEKTIQILGRLTRKHESKDKTYIDDIQYQGPYLTRHSNHRKNFYIKEGLKVIKVNY